MVVFDTTTLLAAIAPPERVQVRVGDRLIADARERIDYLIETLDQSKTKVLVPTPSLSEALVRAGQKVAEEYFARIVKASAFQIRDFDSIAALEAALMTAEALRAGDKRGGAQGTWQKVKVDRQIIAIARVHGAKTIYSNDKDLETLGPKAGLQVIGIEQLPLRPPPPRVALPLLDHLEAIDAKGSKGESHQ